MFIGCDGMKMLASDFDLTLYVDDDNIVQRNIDAIRSFIKNGNLFGIVTGRNYSNIKQLLNQYNIPYHYLICQDGAKIFDSMDYCFFTKGLLREDIIRIIPIFEKYQFNYYLDDGYNQTKNMDDCVKGVGVIGRENKNAQKVVNELLELGFYAYLSVEHINVISGSINKKTALENVLVHANCDRDNLYVIGDNINDLEMLSSFQGAIMKSHSRELDVLDKKSYTTLYEFIEELEKN